MKDTITKHHWLVAQRCLAMAWHAFRSTPAPPDEADRFRMRQGQEIGALARKLYSSGVLVLPKNGESAIAVTQQLIAQPVETIFEAAFGTGPFVAKADILRSADGAWHVLEVKSSFSDTASLDDLVDDLAYTVMVLKRSRLRIGKASLVLLSRQYRFGDGPERLFETVDVTGDVLARAAEFDSAADGLAAALFHDTRPEPRLATVCRDCAVFGDVCLGAGLDHTVLEITGLQPKKLLRLVADGIVDLADLPDDLKLNDRQQRAVKASLSRQLYVENGLGDSLSAITWPCHYLDFETVATVLPLYDGHGDEIRPISRQLE